MNLSRRQKNILEALYPDVSIEEPLFKHQFDLDTSDKPLKALRTEKLICFDSSQLYKPIIIRLTESGRAYVDNMVAEKEKERRLFLHNWKIAVFSSLFGAIAGLVTSFIFWLLNK